MKIVSFIIPCYNVEHCVEHCIQTILQPTILDNIEILAVNDGSKDNTLKVLRKYESQYPEVVRVLDKPNGGWGTVINLAVKEAKGKYVKEVDADDWIESKNLTAYITKLKTLDCDYIATEYKDYYRTNDSYTPHTYQPQCYNHLCTMEQFWKQYPDAWCFPIHAVTYRTELLRRIDLTIGDRYYTDIEYILYPLPHVQHLCVLPINLSVYYHGSDEQSTGPAGYRKHYQNYIDLAKKLVNFENQLSTHTLPAVKACISQNVQGVINFSYQLLLSPLYVGKQPGIQQERKVYDRWLKANASSHHKTAGRLKKRGLPYVAFWRTTGINLLSLCK